MSVTTAAPIPADTRPPLSEDDLAAIEGRLKVGGLFMAHAHTDLTRLLAEVRRLRTTDTGGPPLPNADDADRRI